MIEAQGWLVDARLAWIVLGVWCAAVLVYGVWRSLGDAPQDPIRESGPF